jgi:hypothetical protein
MTLTKVSDTYYYVILGFQSYAVSLCSCLNGGLCQMKPFDCQYTYNEKLITQSTISKKLFSVTYKHTAEATQLFFILKITQIP